MRAILFLLLLMMSCHARIVPVSPVDHRPVCEAACYNAITLGCIPEDDPCVDMCIAGETNGYETIHPKCVATATTCEQVEIFSKYGCST